ncbi:MAG: TIGR03790 family protein, partial [Planctomycetota bacterium]|nr:TIGR03790 family protein [Planctomycetota bacterium]
MSLLICALILQVSVAVDTTEEVVILTNEAVPESIELGKYYASRRKIPAKQILSVKTGTKEGISWPDYRSQIEEPLRRFLKSRPEVKYIVPIYGIPVKIREENKENDQKTGESLSRYVKSRDYCCLDREIELLHKEHELEGWVRSETFRLNRSLTKDDGVYLVCRLDGPSPESVRAMIDNAIYGETYGIEGISFLDTRGLTEGAHSGIDREMKKIVSVYERYEIPFTHDDQAEVVPLGKKPNQAHYWGWYTTHVKAEKGFRFNRGAVGAHMHSYSAGRLRNRDKNWTGPLIHHGITATCGTVYEPLASGFPFGTIFLDRFFQGYNFGEAMQMANMFTSWMAVFVGDPLYAPYAKGRPEQQARNRELLREGARMLEEKLDTGKIEDAMKLAQEVSALPSLSREDPYLFFLLREVRARSIEPSSSGGSVGDLWNAIQDGEGEKGLRFSSNNFECNLLVGESLLGKKRGEEALPYLQRAVEVDPESGRAREILGKGFLQVKKREEALTSFEEAYRLGGRESALVEVGNLLLSQKKYQEVVARLEGISAQNPHALLLVARSFLALKQSVQAVTLLEEGAKASSATVDTWNLLGKAYRSVGNRTEAKKVSSVVKSFSARKRANWQGSRRQTVQKRVGELFEKNPGKILSPL